MVLAISEEPLDLGSEINRLLHRGGEFEKVFVNNGELFVQVEWEKWDNGVDPTSEGRLQIGQSSGIDLGT